jgi:F-type H+-transporting ATPase subunit delta
MKEQRVAIRYAKSLIDLSIEKGAVDAVYNDVQLIENTFNANPAFLRAMKSPIVSNLKKESILVAVFENKVNAITLGLMRLVTRKNRENVLHEISIAYKELYRAYKGITLAEVTTVEALTNEQRQSFRDLLSKKAKTIELSEKVDTSILGGFIIKFGDEQIDQSIKTKLNKVKNNLIDQSYITKY